MALTFLSYATLFTSMTWPEHKLEQGELELYLLPLIGGRLMDVRYKGSSLLFQNPNLVGRVPDLERLSELPSRASHLPFPLWGGEKTWLAPDSQWPNDAPHAVLDSGSYKLNNLAENEVNMTSTICPQSGMQISRTIRLNNDKHWTVRHEVTNKSATEKKLGLWSVLMTRTPASFLFREANRASPTTVFGDPQDAYSSADGIGQISCDDRREFKLGAHPETGMTAACIPIEKGIVWLANTARIERNSNHYAHGHALEFYNSGHYDYGELEWHSPAVTLHAEQSHAFILNYFLVPESRSTSAREMFTRIEEHYGFVQ